MKERESIIIKINKIAQNHRKTRFKVFNGRTINSANRKIIPDSNDPVCKKKSSNLSVRAKSMELKRVAPSPEKKRNEIRVVRKGTNAMKMSTFLYNKCETPRRSHIL